MHSNPFAMVSIPCMLVIYLSIYIHIYTPRRYKPSILIQNKPRHRYIKLTEGTHNEEQTLDVKHESLKTSRQSPSSQYCCVAKLFMGARETACNSTNMQVGCVKHCSVAKIWPGALLLLCGHLLCLVRDMGRCCLHTQILDLWALSGFLKTSVFDINIMFLIVGTLCNLKISVSGTCLD